MKHIFRIIGLSILSLIFASCGDYLDVGTKGALGEDIISKPSDLDGYVTAAYSFLPNHGFRTSHNPWMHGSMRSDDAYKGGSGLTDQDAWHQMEIFTTTSSNVGNNDGVWFGGYEAISRYNTAIRLLQNVDVADYPLKEERIGEMKFLRGYTYFNMKVIWKYVPIITEEIEQSPVAHEAVPNRVKEETGDQYIWDFILADLKDAAERLPERQDKDKGRVDKYAAKAMVAKTLLFMAYEQDDKHQVTNVNKEKLTEALKYIEEIVAKEGAYFDLCEDIGDNFLPEYDNKTKESLFETQYSINDGTTDGRVNWGDELNSPPWSPHFNCCDFHKISYNLANAFITDANGLPMFDDFNKYELKNNFDTYFKSHSFDPRFSHTAAVPGHPFKYDPALLFEETGSRNPETYGYLKSMKELVHPDCDCLFNVFYVQNSMNKKNIRYAEILLWKAEILTQLGRQLEALPIINKIRTRSANSTMRLRHLDGSYVLDYKIGTYKDGVNCTWTQDFAMKAIQWENRLEMAGEGRRFFDLQRWGILPKTMNDYFTKEKSRFQWMSFGYFTAGRDEYKPIPQDQMNWSKGNYTQNPNY